MLSLQAADCHGAEPLISFSEKLFCVSWLCIIEKRVCVKSSRI